MSELLHVHKPLPKTLPEVVYVDYLGLISPYGDIGHLRVITDLVTCLHVEDPCLDQYRQHILICPNYSESYYKIIPHLTLVTVLYTWAYMP